MRRSTTCSPRSSAAEPFRRTRRSQGGERLVERRGGPHDRGGLLVVGPVVAADVDRTALDTDQLLGDRLLVLGQPLGEVAERGGKLGVLRLLRQLLGPVQ